MKTCIELLLVPRGHEGYVKTLVDIDWTSMTESDLRLLASRALVAKVLRELEASDTLPSPRTSVRALSYVPKACVEVSATAAKKVQQERELQRRMEKILNAAGGVSKAELMDVLKGASL